MFIFSIVLSLFLLVLAAPIVYNFEEIFTFNNAETEKNYKTDYSDGYVELNMDMRIERFSTDRYYYYLSCHLTSGSAVEIVGLKHLNYTVNISGSKIYSNVPNWDPPTEQFSYYSTVVLRKDDIISWSGSAEVQFISNSIIQNETFDFILRIIIPMDSTDHYNLAIIENFVFYLWILAFPLGPIILYLLFQPLFGGPLDDETRKKNRRYFDFFKKHQKEQDIS